MDAADKSSYGQSIHKHEHRRIMTPVHPLWQTQSLHKQRCNKTFGSDEDCFACLKAE